MKNTHLEHPEDCILTGNLSVLDAFLLPLLITLKIDGAPAIVWGTNPETGNFFVGTKSVFNKVKIKINESHTDIEQNHDGQVADILHYCLDNLPDHEGIIQGDFIGFGGDDIYTPNTLTYFFDEDVDAEIIVAPHTSYKGECLRDAIASPLMENMQSTETCKFVQPRSFIRGEVECFDDLEDAIKFAKQMSQAVDFVDEKEAKELKKVLNSCIRQGIEIDSYDFPDNENLIGLWLLVKSIKEDALSLCRHESDFDTYLGENEIQGEGYVMHTQHGMYKLVQREVFSYANFNNQGSFHST